MPSTTIQSTFPETKVAGWQVSGNGNFSAMNCRDMAFAYIVAAGTMCLAIILMAVFYHYCQEPRRPRKRLQYPVWYDDDVEMARPAKTIDMDRPVEGKRTHAVEGPKDSSKTESEIQKRDKPMFDDQMRKRNGGTHIGTAVCFAQFFSQCATKYLWPIYASAHSLIALEQMLP